MRSGIKATFHALALLVIELGSVMILHRLGSQAWLQVNWSDLGGWLQASPLEDVVASISRIVALGVAYYLLLTTALYWTASISRVPSAIRAAGLVTLPGLRRRIDRAVTVGVVTGSLLGGSATTAIAADVSGPEVIATATDDTVATPVDTEEESVATPIDESDEPDTEIPDTDFLLGPLTGEEANEQAAASDEEGEASAPDVTTPPAKEGEADQKPSETGTPILPGVPLLKAPDTGAGNDESKASDNDTKSAKKSDDKATPTPDVEVKGSQSYRVAEGDNLWKIAEARLAESKGSAPTQDEVRDYWLKIVEANRGSLLSGNPDLIYPNEKITLPTI